MIIEPGLALSLAVAVITLIAQRRLTSAWLPSVTWVCLLLSGRVLLDGYSQPLLHTLAIASPIVLLAMGGLLRLRASKGYWLAMPIVAAVLVLFGLMTVNIDLEFD